MNLSFIDAAETILPAGYAHASGDCKFRVDKRQLFYACRESFRNATGREISANWFSETLVKYMNTHPETADWKITGNGTAPKENAAKTPGI